MRSVPLVVIALAVATVAAFLPAAPPRERAGKPGVGQLRLNIVDQATGKPLDCRVHLKNQFNVARKIDKMPFWHDHFACPGELDLELPKGNYTFVIERGPEYVDASGHFTMVDFGVDQKTIELKRAVDMAAEGWWSGDLHVLRPLRDIERLMLADDLHVAQVVTWTDKKSDWAAMPLPKPLVVKFDTNRYYHTIAGKDERGGGALLYFNLPEPLKWTGLAREYPATQEMLDRAKQVVPDAWVDAEKPFWWDFPIWLASGRIDSIALAHSHLLRSGMTKNEAWGKPRDKVRYPDPHGNGLWSHDIYYHALNCGLRIPPSAGSGSGLANNPLGYNRMYVHVDPDDFNYETWWQGFRAGRVVVTNGPLIRPLANGQLPGHVFSLAAGEELEIDIVMNLATRDPLDYLEVVQDGRTVRSVRLEEWARTGHFPPLKLKHGGWFLVRVVTKNQETFRFASSAPWYVEVDREPRRISRRSAQFFLDWVNERAAQIPLTVPAQHTSEVIRHVDAARIYWESLVSQANAE